MAGSFCGCGVCPVVVGRVRVYYLRAAVSVGRVSSLAVRVAAAVAVGRV